MSGSAGAAPRAKQVTRRRVVFRVTLLFAVILLALGFAGAGALRLLQHAMRTPSDADLAQLVCTAYQTQNYDVLIQQIDPKPAPPATGSFDAAGLKNQLRELDSTYGHVTSCTYGRLAYSNTPADSNLAQYSFKVQRAHLPQAGGMLMTFVRTQGSIWKISRISAFVDVQS